MTIGRGEKNSLRSDTFARL